MGWWFVGVGLEAESRVCVVEARGVHRQCFGGAGGRLGRGKSGRARKEQRIQRVMDAFYTAGAESA